MGLSWGWAMGAYQMLKGAHYLSHILVTMLLAWIGFLLIQRLILKREDWRGEEAGRLQSGFKDQIDS